MSKANHPNIHAVNLTVDVWESIQKHLRGDAIKNEKIKSKVLKKIHNSGIMVKFVAQLSTYIDEYVDIIDIDDHVKELNNGNIVKITRRKTNGS